MKNEEERRVIQLLFHYLIQLSTLHGTVNSNVNASFAICLNISLVRFSIFLINCSHFVRISSSVRWARARDRATAQPFFLRIVVVIVISLPSSYLHGFFVAVLHSTGALTLAGKPWRCLFFLAALSTLAIWFAGVGCCLFFALLSAHSYFCHVYEDIILCNNRK